MKKTFLAKRNALMTPAGFSAGAAALAFVAALALVRFVFPGLFLLAVSPFWSAGNALSVATHPFFASVGDARALSAQNETLTAENQALANENRALSDKVASLAALLGDTSGSPALVSGIVSGVVARPPVSPYDTFVLGRGTDDGVARGMEAFGDGGVPLGVVTSVTAGFSRVTLFSAPGESLAAWVGSAHTPVELTGAGAGAFSARSPRAAAIHEGDAVYAPGPGGLPIGSVRKIAGDPAAPTVELDIAPALNPFSQTWVVLRDASGGLVSALTCATTSAP